MRAGSWPARADATAIYTDDALPHDRAQYERRIGELFSARFWGYMTGPEIRALAGVRIAMPLRGGTPVDAYAPVDGGPPPWSCRSSR